MDGATIKAQTFRTPARILIPKLAASRDGWKTKAGERKRRLKAARIRIRDLENSRARWRERAGAAEEQVAELKRRCEADRLRDELKKK